MRQPWAKKPGIFILGTLTIMTADLNESCRCVQTHLIVENLNHLITQANVEPVTQRILLNYLRRALSTREIASV